jgi:small subunit ribosomal protein S21
VYEIKVTNYYNRNESGVCVVKRKTESDEDLLRRFRKKFSKSGLMKEIKEKMYFEKPSDKKRRKRAQAAQIRRQEEEKREKFANKRKKFNKKKEQQND